MYGLYRCERCGSVGSIEFGMCQVCLHDYAGEDGLAFHELLQMEDGGNGQIGATNNRVDTEKDMMASV